MVWDCCCSSRVVHDTVRRHESRDRNVFHLFVLLSCAVWAASSNAPHEWIGPSVLSLFRSFVPGLVVVWPRPPFRVGRETGRVTVAKAKRKSEREKSTSRESERASRGEAERRPDSTRPPAACGRRCRRPPVVVVLAEVRRRIASASGKRKPHTPAPEEEEHEARGESQSANGDHTHAPTTNQRHTPTHRHESSRPSGGPPLPSWWVCPGRVRRGRARVAGGELPCLLVVLFALALTLDRRASSVPLPPSR